MTNNLQKQILIVEDDRTTIRVLSSFVTSLGYSIMGGVVTGDEAVELLKTKRADLILMDISLEGAKDGIETAAAVNELYNIPVIFITSSSDIETIERSKATNPFGYIIKPIDRKELKAGIEMAFLRFNMESRLKENEEKLSAILNSIGDAVIVADTGGIINYANPVARKFLEIEGPNIVGSPLNDIFKIQEQKPGDPGNGAKNSNGGYLFIKDQSSIPISYSVAPINNSMQTGGGSVIVFKDDTERMKSQEKIRDSFEKLSKAMSGIILAMAHALETRDPYTAGHQRRVADLAGLIAVEMGLSENVIEAVRMSGTIHDLGKISIPAEILSKPGRLTSIEFELIKTHSQTGYDILKNIDFPWPLADIIHQHHEKLDGSGYPLGLTDGDILPEAKILAVADAVEAMASHRPYRAALGIDFALAEIMKYSGTYYDAGIVDTCVSLFHDKGYVMKFS